RYLEGGSGSAGGPGVSAGEQAQFMFFVAAFSMLAKLAKADGRVSKEEIDSIEKFMLYDLNLDPQGRRVAMNIFQTAVQSPETFENFALQFYGQFSGQPQMLDLMVDIMLRVSLADGTMSPGEEKLILSAIHIFNFSDEHYRQISSRYVKNVDKYYAILGCSPGDPDDQIKSEYRKRVAEYHPDKIASKGLPEEFTKFAAEKFREIQEAYETIKKERGIK
ncbi:MAG: DnaJ domain-containing protein, partial [Desulfobacterales bacterium]|nr:DnaJ domain-containing protein [Desulfobacterales bacterium]